MIELKDRLASDEKGGGSIKCARKYLFLWSYGVQEFFLDCRYLFEDFCWFFWMKTIEN